MEKIIVLDNEKDMEKAIKILQENQISLSGNYEKYEALMRNKNKFQFENNLNQLLKIHMEYLMMAGNQVYNDLPDTVKVDIGSTYQDGEELHFIESVNYPNPTNNQYIWEIKMYLEEQAIMNILEGFYITGLSGIQEFSFNPRTKIKQVF